MIKQDEEGNKILWIKYIRPQPPKVKDLIELLEQCDPEAKIGIAGVGVKSQFRSVAFLPHEKYHFITVYPKSVAYIDYTDGDNEIKLLGYYAD
jgi:hypothetical protein